MSRAATFAAALAVAGALLLAGCGGAGAPRPDLVFVSTRDGDYALYAMNADGSREVRISGEEPEAAAAGAVYFEVDPAFSPDGRRLAFASRRAGSFDLYTMNVDGTGLRRLTRGQPDERRPSYAPDGRRIVYARGAPPDLYVMNADGSNARRLTSDAAEETEPAWSPDGRSIAYVRRTPGTELREIWVVGADGDNARRLTSLDAASYTPAWSPDGERLAFASDARDSRLEIYVVRASGREPRRLTFSDDDAFDPAWSPDGRSIAFSRGGAIVVAQLDGGDERLTDPDDNDSSPVWNPRPPPAD